MEVFLKRERQRLVTWEVGGQESIRVNVPRNLKSWKVKAYILLDFLQRCWDKYLFTGFKQSFCQARTSFSVSGVIYLFISKC